jgi:PHP-associated/PHP domain
VRERDAAGSRALVRSAASNNAAWCAAVCQTHGVARAVGERVWTCAGRPPPYYPNIVTLRPDADDHDVLPPAVPAGYSVKDSFATLELSSAGFDVLFDAEWIHRPAGTPAPCLTRAEQVLTASQLRDWQAAWHETAPPSNVFRPSLLADPDVRIVAVWAGDELVGGGVLNLAAGVVGVTNVHSRPDTDPVEVWKSLVLAASEHFPGVDMVGYEHSEDLTHALEAGFRTIGPLRIWLARASDRGRGWYRGDCHVHSERSHAADQTPAQLATQARALGLDFIAVTEHNTAAAHETWAAVAGDNLLVILGQEATTRTGHWVALGLAPEQQVEWRYGVRDDLLDRQLAAVREVGGLCVAAHPHAPYPGGVLMYPLDVFDLVEVWNGLWRSDRPWNADNEAALAEWGRGLAMGLHRGRWLPAIANSDAHLAGQLGRPHTVVLADELSTAAVLAGLRAGRSWLADSTTVWLSFEVVAGDRGAGIGDRVRANGEPLVARLEVRGVPSGSVSFHTEQGVAHRLSLPANGSDTREWRFSVEDTGFVWVQVRYGDGSMAAITNPVLISP